jgi:deazaflavin-dependent oxidoreductase (nitroreductase family)
MNPVQKAFLNMMSSTHTGLYRLTGGAIGGKMFGAPILLLTTTGRKTGKQRTTPLLYLPDGENLVIVASKGGAPEHPAWFFNLKANPQVTVQLGRDVRKMAARESTPDEKARLWPKLTAMYSGYADYQKKTTREIPLVILSRASA